MAAWFDFERDGDFGGPGDHFQVISVHDGANSMAVPVPAGVGGPVFARFRFGSVLSEVTSLTGQASDGEVEDYVFHVVDYLKDFGDAPNGTSAQGTPQTYPTTVANNGAWHATNLNPDLYLGSVPPDSELDGKPSADGRGDDLAGVDDEDGVDLANRVLLADGGTPNAFPVTVTGEGYLNAWIDLRRRRGWGRKNTSRRTWFQPDPGTDWQTRPSRSRFGFARRAEQAAPTPDSASVQRRIRATSADSLGRGRRRQWRTTGCSSSTSGWTTATHRTASPAAIRRCGRATRPPRSCGLAASG